MRSASHHSKIRCYSLGPALIALGLFCAIDFTFKNTIRKTQDIKTKIQKIDQPFDKNLKTVEADRPGRKKYLKFIHITKNGGTTIEEIGQAFGLSWGKYHKEYGWRHKPFVTKERELIEKYDWFMVVRNPFDRIISEFHCTWGGVSDFVDSFDSKKFNWYIREKIRASEEMKIGTFGSHYVPQYRYLTSKLTNPPLGINGKPYNPILHFENLAEDFDALMEARGLAPRFSNQTPNEQSNHKKVFTSMDFDSETVDLILDIYDEDFRQFGYSRDPKDSAYAFEVDRTPVSTKKAEDYKIFVRTPENISPDEMIKCFEQRHDGSSIFKDSGKKIAQEGKRNAFINEYFPQVLVDLYLWRVSQRWQTTTNLSEADIVLLLHFPLISKYAGDCKGTTHEDRQKSVVDWASKNLPDSAIGALVCPSFTGCDGNEIYEKFGSNVKILLKERNPKWLLSYGDRAKKITPPPIYSEMVNDPNKTIAIPYTVHRNLKRWHSRLLEVPDDEPYNAPQRCNPLDTNAPWCDGIGRGKHKWKMRKHVLFIGDIRGDAVREGIGKVVERDDTKVSYTSLNPTYAEKGKRTAVKSYAFQMSNARFCLIPRGDSPTSRRFFDSIVAGCLPIVISDDLDSSLPFSDVIPYDAFWFRVAESDWISDPNAVLDRIVSIPERDIGKRLRIMETYVPLLDWTDVSHESGFRRIIEELV